MDRKQVQQLIESYGGEIKKTNSANKGDFYLLKDNIHLAHYTTTNTILLQGVSPSRTYRGVTLEKLEDILNNLYA
jgi:hypothetical protein